MKSLLLSTVLLALAAGCHGKDSDTGNHTDMNGSAAAPTTMPSDLPAKQASADAKPINKFCAVDKGNEVDPTVTTVYKGQTIGFCCEDCIPKFKKDPEKYMKDLK